MKTEKLTIEHIAPYLPYGLRVFTKYNEFEDDYTIYTVTGISKYEDDSILWEYNDGYHLKKHIIKPILRPLEDLVKPCLEDGKIPIVELAKIAFGKKKKFTVTHNGNCMCGSLNFGYDKHTNSFRLLELDGGCIGEVSIPVLYQLDLFQFLFKHHFNVFDLPQDLWIDINTIK